MRRLASLIAVLVVLTGLVAPVGSAGAQGESSTPTTQSHVSATHGPPTGRAAVPPAAKFVLHAGLAAGAFHRYIYKPFKAGTFNHGAKGRRIALLKAGLAGLFAFHELRLAINDAKASKTLSRLVAPVSALAARMRALGGSLRRGQLRPADVNQANGQLGALTSQSARAGAPIKDVTPPANLKPTG